MIPGSGFNNLQLSAGDLDDDGADELAAVAGGAKEGDRLLVVDWSGNGITILADIRYREGTSKQLTTVAVGNVDGDPRPEIVVVNGVYGSSLPAHFYVYSWTGTVLGEEVESGRSLPAIRPGPATSSRRRDAAGSPMLQPWRRGWPRMRVAVTAVQLTPERPGGVGDRSPIAVPDGEKGKARRLRAWGLVPE